MTGASGLSGSVNPAPRTLFEAPFRRRREVTAERLEAQPEVLDGGIIGSGPRAQLGDEVVELRTGHCLVHYAALVMRVGISADTLAGTRRAKGSGTPFCTTGHTSLANSRMLASPTAAGMPPNRK